MQSDAHNNQTKGKNKLIHTAKNWWVKNWVTNFTAHLQRCKDKQSFLFLQ